jgi:hypothetical protein
MTLDEQKSQLFPLLQKAIELELSTIPPYLTALLSIRPDANRDAARLIRSVMMEEMLHMVLVANLASSLGGGVRLGEANIPSYPLRMTFEGKTFRDRNFDVDLAAFSPQSLATFLQIELPTALAMQKAQVLAFPSITISGLTIGEFYHQILRQLEAMCAAFPEQEVFSGDPCRQIDESFFWAANGRPIVITDLARARQALEVVIEQGEGGDGSVYVDDEHYFDQPDEVAHYFRFNEIAVGRYYRPGDRPRDEPSGPPLPVDYGAVLPIQRNAKSTDYAPGTPLAVLNDLFNRQYSLMLTQLEQAFNGSPFVLYDAIINAMHQMASLAQEMIGIPIDGGSGTHGAPSFEWVAPPTLD